MEKSIIENSQTIAEVIKKLYGYDNGSTRKKFLKYVEDNNLDISNLRSRELKYPTIVKNCPVCGNNFETKKGNRDEKITCSYSCSNTYFRSGNSNPNWKDESYRTTCFFYHKKECIICGEDKIVTVHHFDENHNNNSPENLIPLCPTHHQYVHSKHKNEVIDKINFYRDFFIKTSS